MIGEMIGNHLILSQIGQGGMGTVYQGEDTRLGRKVAIKILNPSLLARGGKELERFQSEAKVQANLNNPNVVTLYGFEPYKDSWAMIMEYVEGRTLADLVRTYGALPSSTVIIISKQVLDGLSAAHRQGVVHRDLKPSNIMLTAEGVAKVMDFGIAKVQGGKSLTASGALVGTVFYMSPEQVRGEPVDARSDLYSFGIILFELLTGRVPFKDESDFSIMIHHVQTPPPPPTQLLPEIPSDLEDIVLRCLNKAPDQRYQSASEIHAALEAFEERERAIGRGPLYARKALAAWLAEPGLQRAGASAAPQEAKIPPPPPPRVTQVTRSAPGAPPPALPTPPQAVASSDSSPVAARPAPAAPAPTEAKPTSGKGLLLVAIVMIIVLAGAGLTWYRMRRATGVLPAMTQSGQPTSQAQASLSVNAPPTTTIPAATTSAPEQAQTSTPPSTAATAAPAAALSGVTSATGATNAAEPKTTATPPAERNVEQAMPLAERNAERVTPPSKPTQPAQPSTIAAVPRATKSKAVPPAVKSGTSAPPEAGQAESAETKPSGGFLIFVDLDQGSERVPLGMAQSRVAEIIREAGHQVVSAGVVSANVRAALDHNDLAEVRRNGVSYVVMGTAHASVEQQAAYGSTYYVGQVSVSFELVRMSDGKVVANGSSNARSRGSANVHSALSEALMTATSDAARDLMRISR
jgi:predicted Ser/Thr protein kinase